MVKSLVRLKVEMRVRLVVKLVVKQVTTSRAPARAPAPHTRDDGMRHRCIRAGYNPENEKTRGGPIMRSNDVSFTEEPNPEEPPDLPRVQSS
jgi:hypothetical protein